MDRLVAAILAGLAIALGVAEAGLAGALRTVIIVIIPFACIWFTDAMSGYGIYRGNSSVTPGIIVRGMGWIWLGGATGLFVWRAVSGGGS